MKKIKSLSALLLAGIFAFSAVGCGGGESEEAATDTALTNTPGVLVWATNAEFEPYEYREGGEIVGIDAEIAQRIADEIGCELEISDMNFDSIVSAIATGKADIGIAGMTVTEDRLMNVNFSDPYVNAGQAIIVAEDSEITGEADLADKTVGVQLGTTGDLYVTENISGVTVERYTKGFEAVQALIQGKIDAVVIDGEPAKAFVASNEGIKLCDDYLTVEEYAIAMNKNNDALLSEVNSILAEMQEDGSLQAIFDKYLNSESSDATADEEVSDEEGSDEEETPADEEAPVSEQADGEDAGSEDASLAAEE